MLVFSVSTKGGQAKHIMPEFPKILDFSRVQITVFPQINTGLNGAYIPAAVLDDPQTHFCYGS